MRTQKYNPITEKFEWVDEGISHSGYGTSDLHKCTIRNSAQIKRVVEKLDTLTARGRKFYINGIKRKQMSGDELKRWAYKKNWRIRNELKLKNKE